jgi:histidinol dehydrogenase
MMAIPAKIAGCKRIVLCTPPEKDRTINSAILYAAQSVGVLEIYKAGGAQAIAALAYGTESIPKVDKIFGPGNQYVTCAKQLVAQQGVAIDMPAGPSEVAVYADETCVVDFVASDLLSQAEHGPDSQVLLVAPKESLVEQVEAALVEQLEGLPRKEIAAQALTNSEAVVLRDESEAFDFINEYAPEHFIIASDRAEEFVGRVFNAGSVFLGNYTPEAVGDYASGTNHVLPTNRAARAFSGVSLDSFVKKITFQQLSRDGLYNLAQTVIQMAEAESLKAHAQAIRLRVNSISNK